jgi:hypothetical protein
MMSAMAEGRDRFGCLIEGLGVGGVTADGDERFSVTTREGRLLVTTLLRFHDAFSVLCLTDLQFEGCGMVRVLQLVAFAFVRSDLRLLL